MTLFIKYKNGRYGPLAPLGMEEMEAYRGREARESKDGHARLLCRPLAIDFE
jgi:hypothetical protein